MFSRSILSNVFERTPDPGYSRSVIAIVYMKLIIFNFDMIKGKVAEKVNWHSSFKVTNCDMHPQTLNRFLDYMASSS